MRLSQEQIISMIDQKLPVNQTLKTKFYEIISAPSLNGNAGVDKMNAASDSDSSNTTADAQPPFFSLTFLKVYQTCKERISIKMIVLALKIPL